MSAVDRNEFRRRSLPVAFFKALGSNPVLKSLRWRPAAMIAGILLCVIILAAIFAPWLATQDPYDVSKLDLLDSHLPPAWLAGGDARFLLGTDSQGADLLSLLLYGLRTSLMVGVLAVSVSVSLGLIMGLLSGYFGGIADAVIMRMADIQFTFPAMLMALLIGGISKSLLPLSVQDRYAMLVVIFALGISHWPHFARLVRAATLTQRNKDYVAAARLIGHSHLSVIARQILPNVLNAVFVLATMDIAFAVMTEATLSFLGFGMPTTQPSLGTLIKIGYSYLFSGEWWVVVFPSSLLVILLISINVFGDWVRDYFDPKLR
ncbi:MULTISPECIES: ABC transporter permease [unclassified Chelatococcus]|uniref:ABC transporter permease n=1 Tax=unclassified Chelatococcus TaxID=2638111 RepID=UPI001BD0AFDC|nr:MULTISPECIES: ABC transporter permease [unclassified Chelatococcus]CAH1654701.1 ABC transporter permease [Hyphomicrobiales bacterium]MBS7740286.1 ABC transporter permease [Chelatococcus sp. HY11]MBX3544884.1 ABC transporter permease [Chelatococcus sp.]MCO5078473.1 ABC transporter permease [Chelatococcus sp.]CAH1685340.1 ABC transporter permease [Hyphomicrobiales bacterium]